MTPLQEAIARRRNHQTPYEGDSDLILTAAEEAEGLRDVVDAIDAIGVLADHRGEDNFNDECPLCVAVKAIDAARALTALQEGK